MTASSEHSAMGSPAGVGFTGGGCVGVTGGCDGMGGEGERVCCVERGGTGSCVEDGFCGCD